MLMNRSPAPSRRLAPRARLVALALCVPLALSAAIGIAHASDPLAIKMDRAKVMRISRPAATVVVGNPAIADATIQDRQTLIITGRSFGTTNLIVLDEAGEPIADELVTVSASDDQMVTVYSGADRRSFSCAPDCQPVLTLGDTTTAFAEAQSQLAGRNSIVQGATGQPN
ncbi:Pilus formation protein N terminal region [Kaistia soli DSM 19436]|uniref:Pilus formation protein N terminal region n=2 Tax=Kaistia TaxID=166953 RepID=A0A1M5P2U7_9HYPH|nr:Pilus formation protein N terminal region [Kaistia soli DSM 19436]